MTKRPRLNAQELADLLGVHPPTSEQRAIIEAPLEGVYRVVAGAGSGKTETMALRVVWLVANAMVHPRDVLGLTFTRKAAGELAERIRTRLRALPPIYREQWDEFQSPEVSTYNSFAARLFRDFGVYLGHDPASEVAGQAAAWALARRAVVGSNHPGLADVDYSVAALTNMTVRLANAISENVVDTVALEHYSSTMAELTHLPLGGRGRFERELGSITAGAAMMPIALELVKSFHELKDQRGLVEFSDQVRLALEVIEARPEVGDEMRARYQVVLLDEYQDTSVVQTRLLSRLFAHHPVMAVGDPHQAIYGWRGAGAANLADFPDAFAAGRPVQTFGLQVSWRNGERILASANTLAAALGGTVGAEVGQLRPRDRAPLGILDWVYPDTLAEEAAAVAVWFKEKLAESSAPPSAALLLRTRSHLEVFRAALTAHAVPVHVLGVGGLLADPVVAELICGLCVVHRSRANPELVRLLTSGRFRLGARDLWALARVARTLSRRADQSSLETADGPERVDSESFSLVDALDQWESPGVGWDELSESARAQLGQMRQLLQRARRIAHEPVVDQIAWWMRELGLDIEILAHPDRSASLAARDALLEAVDRYDAVSGEGGVSGFLDWLEHAEMRDGLSPHTEPAEPGCVQILTIHSAKGLEWDVVAVARMVEDELPAKPREGLNAWLAPGHLPYPFRADSEHLPRFDWEKATTRKELVEAYKHFREDVGRYSRMEERRLAYVALTRAKSALLLSGSFWTDNKLSRPPSPFLTELAAAGLIGPLPDGPENAERPELATETLAWPGDPLGSRREALERAAKAFAAAATIDSPRDSIHQQTIERVLQREHRQSTRQAVSWPVRIPASQFDRWIYEPELMLSARRTPTPSTVGLAQQRGTAFHEWVEGYFHSAETGRLIADVDLDSSAEVAGVEGLERFQANFVASPFAKATPLALEREIHYPLAGHLIICKIDAVFELEGVVRIVDWKTGAAPKSRDDRDRRALQLALYRLAWARWCGLDPDEVRASLWFAGTGEALEPEHLPDEAQLAAMLEQAKARVTTGQARG